MLLTEKWTENINVKFDLVNRTNAHGHFPILQKETSPKVVVFLKVFQTV